MLGQGRGVEPWDATEGASGALGAAAGPGALLLPPPWVRQELATRAPFFLSLHSPLRMCPIFQISNVTGENLDLLKMFLNLLSPRTSYREEEPAEFQIDDTYSVPVSGFWWTGQGGRLGGSSLQECWGKCVVGRAQVGMDLLGQGLLCRVWGQWCRAQH